MFRMLSDDEILQRFKELYQPPVLVAAEDLHDHDNILSEHGYLQGWQDAQQFYKQKLEKISLCMEYGGRNFDDGDEA